MIYTIRCLCLDKRKELWSKLNDFEYQEHKIIFKKFICGDGTDSSLEYDHIDVEPPTNRQFLYTLNKGHYNAFLCHKKMARQAIEENDECTIFMEDDAYLVPSRFNTIFFSSRVQNFIQNYVWDIIYLGWWYHKTGTDNEDREDLERDWNINRNFGIAPVDRPPVVTHEISGLHGIIISPSVLREITNIGIGPIDAVLNRNLDSINAYFVYPKIIHQHSCWSFCENSMSNRRDIQ